MRPFEELRRAARSLAARPWFAAAAVISLAFGIGANTAVFTIVNALLFRPLPYPSADRLVLARAANTRLGVVGGAVSLTEVELIRERSRTVTDAGVARETDFNLSNGERARRVRGAIVSAATLPTLGIAPAAGVAFVASDDQAGAPARAIVSDRLWRTTLGAGGDVIGRTIRIDGASFEVIGVMPPAFHYPEQSDMWIPVGAMALTAAGIPSRDARLFQVVARLTEGTTLPRAREELGALGRALDSERPVADRGWTLTVTSADRERGENARPAVYLLFALVSCVLLVACANLATLLIARAATRRRDFAVRSALGASPAHLLWHGLAESVVLAVVGGALSLIVAVLGLRAIRLAFPSETLPFWLRFDVDWRVMAYALGLTVVTVLAFGLGPAIWSARRPPASGLVSGSRSATAGLGRSRVTGALIATQVAVSVVLAVTASLLAVALAAMATSQLGYEPTGLVTTDVEPRGRRHLSDDATRGGLFTTLAANVAAIPGVTSVSGFDLWGTAPMELAGSGGRPARPIDGPLYAVLPRYFETMRVTLIVGRTLDEGTVGTASGEAVVNETFARRHWPGEQALGRQIRITRSPGRDEWLTVVGIVADVRRNPADLEREPHVYVSALRFPPRRLRLVARVDGPVMTASALERAARAADPDEPLGPPVTMDQQIAEWTAPSRFFATSLGGFAAVAMLIAVTGVFGVVSGAVAARTREFGIRLALGATPRQMVRLAVGRGARLAAVGAAAGLVVALGVSRVLVALPFGVERIDPAVVAGAAAAMIVVALAAAYTPARRAGRVEPTVALGHDA